MQGRCQALVRAEVGYRSLDEPDKLVTPRVRGQSGMPSPHYPHSTEPLKGKQDLSRGLKGPKGSVLHNEEEHTHKLD